MKSGSRNPSILSMFANVFVIGAITITSYNVYSVIKAYRETINIQNQIIVLNDQQFETLTKILDKKSKIIDVQSGLINKLIDMGSENTVEYAALKVEKDRISAEHNDRKVDLNYKGGNHDKLQEEHTHVWDLIKSSAMVRDYLAFRDMYETVDSLSQPISYPLEFKIDSFPNINYFHARNSDSLEEGKRELVDIIERMEVENEDVQKFLKEENDVRGFMPEYHCTLYTPVLETS